MSTTNNVAVNTPAIDVNEVLAALETWIKQRPGVDPRDYGDGRDGFKSYRAEVRAIGQDRKRALKALDEARGAILADSFRAFSGRLEWVPAYIGTLELLNPDLRFGAGSKIANGAPSVTPAHLSYTTGQYWPTEYRKAAAAVLESYIASWRRKYAAEHPPTFTYRTIEDVKAANRAVGGHWFDADTMRFFHTRIESGLIACDWQAASDNVAATPRKGRFITSERCHEGDDRRYTIREAQPDGSIETIGRFQQYSTRDEARAEVLKEVAA